MTTGNVGLFVQTQRGICMVVLIVLGLLFFVGLARAIKGPRVADRLVAVNMIGTIVMVMIAALSLYLEEEYLLDICLIYAMASFLAVIVLAKVYIGIYEEQHLEHGNAAGVSGHAGEGKADAAGVSGHAGERATDLAGVQESLGCAGGDGDGN